MRNSSRGSSGIRSISANAANRGQRGYARNPRRQHQKGVAMIELFSWRAPNGTEPSIMLEEVGVDFVNLGSG
jgi:hypothetical protein